MAGFGIVIGVAFPPVITLLGVPAAIAGRPSFVTICVAAGIVVGVANFVIARLLVGRRVAALAGQMRKVSSMLEATIALADTGKLDPRDCYIPVHAPDAFGEAAEAFNGLVRAACEARQQQLDLATYIADMASSGGLDDISEVIAGQLRAAAGADQAAVYAVEGCAPQPGSATARQAIGDSIAEPGRWHLVPGTDGPEHVAALAVADSKGTLAVITAGFPGAPAEKVRQILKKLAVPTRIGLSNALLTARLHRLATFDALTGCHNRRAGFDLLEEVWRTDGDTGVLVVDVDHFKAINDSYGHGVGDVVLAQIAATLGAELPAGGTVVRMGGEEFLVVLPGAAEDQVHAAGERMRRAVAASPCTANGHTVPLTVSIGGVSSANVATASVDELVALADDAMYSAKNGGRNRMCVRRGSGRAAAHAVLNAG